MAPKKLYSKEQMNMALELVQRGSSIASAAKQAKVPRVTLLYKVSGKSPKTCSMGPPSSLTCEEETMLVQWILELTKIHYPISKVQLFDSVEYISSVISSQKWQDFNRKKHDLKLKTMQEKKERALLREKKNIEKEQKIDGVKKRVFIDSDKKGKKLQTKKKKITKTKEFDSSDSQSEEEWVPSDSTSESNNEFDESINYNENRDPNENNFKLDLNKNKDDTIKVSDYILVAFPSEKKSFKNYVCVVQEVLSKDEAEVVSMICCNKEKTMFKLNDKDVSVINFSQVIKKMEFPKMLLAGDRLKYEFSEPLDVEEPNAS